MSINAMNWAWDLPDIDSGELTVALCLADHHNKDTGLCCPGIDRIMKRTRKSRATVYRHLKSLQDKGHVIHCGGRYILGFALRSVTASPSHFGTDESHFETAQSQNGTHNLSSKRKNNHPPVSPLKGASSPQGRKPRSRRVREEHPTIPPTWTPNADHLAEAAQGLGGIASEETVVAFVERSAKKFLAHHLGRADCSPDWDALFLSWLMGDLEKATRGRGTPQHMSGYAEFLMRLRASGAYNADEIDEGDLLLPGYGYS